MNKYREVRQIGSGAFSQVIQAIHGPTGDFVAIKKVFRGLNNPNNSSSSAAAAASALAAAQAEADVLTQLRHPNIIHLRETFKDGPQLCIVLEYMDLNLHELITQRDSALFEESAVQGILRQVLEGICFIHSAGYIHRDLKPENLLVHGNVVKIADMGLVRPVHSKRPLTAYVSTRWYRAPELMLQIDIYGCPVDIWAIGTIAAELLSLQPLFPGSSQIDQLQRIFRVLGSPTLTRGNGDAWYVGAVQARKLGVSFNVEKTVPLSDLLPRTVSERMVQFIGSMLRLNPGSRVSAKQALEQANSFFAASFEIPYTLPPGAVTYADGSSSYRSDHIEAQPAVLQHQLLPQQSQQQQADSDAPLLTRLMRKVRSRGDLSSAATITTTNTTAVAASAKPQTSSGQSAPLSPPPMPPLPPLPAMMSPVSDATLAPEVPPRSQSHAVSIDSSHHQPLQQQYQQAPPMRPTHGRRASRTLHSRSSSRQYLNISGDIPPLPKPRPSATLDSLAVPRQGSLDHPSLASMMSPTLETTRGARGGQITVQPPLQSKASLDMNKNLAAATAATATATATDSWSALDDPDPTTASAAGAVPTFFARSRARSMLPAAPKSETLVAEPDSTVQAAVNIFKPPPSSPRTLRLLAEPGRFIATRHAPPPPFVPLPIQQQPCSEPLMGNAADPVPSLEIPNNNKSPSIQDNVSVHSVHADKHEVAGEQDTLGAVAVMHEASLSSAVDDEISEVPQVEHSEPAAGEEEEEVAADFTDAPIIGQEISPTGDESPSVAGTPTSNVSNHADTLAASTNSTTEIESPEQPVSTALSPRSSTSSTSSSQQQQQQQQQQQSPQQQISAGPKRQPNLLSPAPSRSPSSSTDISDYPASLTPSLLSMAGLTPRDSWRLSGGDISSTLDRNFGGSLVLDFSLPKVDAASPQNTAAIGLGLQTPAATPGGGSGVHAQGSRAMSPVPVAAAAAGRRGAGIQMLQGVTGAPMSPPAAAAAAAAAAATATPPRPPVSRSISSGNNQSQQHELVQRTSRSDLSSSYLNSSTDSLRRNGSGRISSPRSEADSASAALRRSLSSKVNKSLRAAASSVTLGSHETPATTAASVTVSQSASNSDLNSDSSSFAMPLSPSSITTTTTSSSLSRRASSKSQSQQPSAELSSQERQQLKAERQRARQELMRRVRNTLGNKINARDANSNGNNNNNSNHDNDNEPTSPNGTGISDAPLTTPGLSTAASMFPSARTSFDNGPSSTAINVGLGSMSDLTSAIAAAAERIAEVPTDHLDTQSPPLDSLPDPSKSPLQSLQLDSVGSTVTSVPSVITPEQSAIEDIKHSEVEISVEAEDVDYGDDEAEEQVPWQPRALQVFPPSQAMLAQQQPKKKGSFFKRILSVGNSNSSGLTIPPTATPIPAGPLSPSLPLSPPPSGRRGGRAVIVTQPVYAETPLDPTMLPPQPTYKVTMDNLGGGDIPAPPQQQTPEPAREPRKKRSLAFGLARNS